MFGQSLSISDSTLISGAQHNDFDENGNDSLSSSGAAYFFEIDDQGNWIEKQKVVAIDRAANDWFGHEVAIDGDYAIIGSPYEDPQGKSGAGSVYIFERDIDGEWREKQKIYASDKQSNKNFGLSIAISGSYIAVGVSNSEAVYLFERSSNGNWTEKQKIVGSGGASGSSFFGTSVALDNDKLLVGASGEGAQEGCVYYFERNGSGTWIEKQKVLTSTRTANQLFGYSISIDDSTFVAVSNHTYQSQQGAAYVFELEGNGQWVEKQVIQALDKKNNHRFGGATDLSNGTLVVGASSDWNDENGQDSIYQAGAIYIFKQNALGIWNESQKIVHFERDQDVHFGAAVGIYQNQLVAGAWGVGEGSPFTFSQTDEVYRGGAIFTFNTGGVFGQVFHDHDYNCIRADQEKGIEGIVGLITPGDIIVSSNDAGRWKISSLPVGNYEIKYDTSGVGNYYCTASQQFSVVNTDSTIELTAFGISAGNCFQPNVSIAMPIVRRCFSDQLIIVKAENNENASETIPDAYLIVELDSNIQLQNSSLVSIDLGNNIFKFQLDSLHPGAAESIRLNVTVSCNAMLDQTLCISVKMYPEKACMFDSIVTVQSEEVAFCNSDYDDSDLNITKFCNNDSVKFIVENNGLGNMSCFVPVRVFKNGNLYFQDSLLLSATNSLSYSFNNEGETWRIEVEQHPKHPGNSKPSSTIEACSETTKWVSGLVSIRPQDDADPNVDIFCGQVSGSYDPNDKTGFPIGVTDTHYVAPNQSMEYLIRFQNTGNDTAFTVVVRDTLQDDFDIFSVQSGAASHSYDFRMYGSRILEWTFNDILLVDSVTNELMSHGFISFKVNQNIDLNDDTELSNRVGIYFDFNDPIITNTTSHVIWRETFEKSVLTSIKNQDRLVVGVYPNPVSETLNIVLNQKAAFSVFNLLGMQIEQVTPVSNMRHQLDVSDYASGVYFLYINGIGKGLKETIKFVIE